MYIHPMVCTTFCPTSFVRVGSEIEVRFMEGGSLERMRWYRGTVKKIFPSTRPNQHGSFLTCAVMYEDGDYHPDTELYDADFMNPESTDAWRFARAEWNTLLGLLEEDRCKLSHLEEQVEEALEGASTYEGCPSHHRVSCSEQVGDTQDTHDTCDTQDTQGSLETSITHRSSEHWGLRWHVLLCSVVLVSVALSLSVPWTHLRDVMPNSWSEVERVLWSMEDL